MTREEAIDQILRDAGMLGLASGAELTVRDGSPESLAGSELERHSRNIQRRGWHFNTVYETLTANEDNTFTVPQSTLRIDTAGASSHIDVYQVGQTLRQHTRDPGDAKTTFEEDSLEIIRVIYRDFCDLPDAVAHYIAAEASVSFVEQQGTDGARSGRLPALRERAMRMKADAERAADAAADFSLTEIASYRARSRQNNYGRSTYGGSVTGLAYGYRWRGH